MKVKCKTKGYGLSLLALGALTITTAAHADYGNSKNHDERRGHNKSKPTDRVITPAAGPRVTNGADLFVSADFIYWRVTQDGTDYARTGIQSNDGSTTVTAPDEAYTDVAQGQIFNVGNDWAPGFKVGVGLDTSHDGWDVYAEYTWVQFKNEQTTSLAPILNTGDTLPISQVYGYGFVSGRDEFKASYQLDYNKVNLELGRNFYFSQYLTARPHAGVTGVWMNNTQRIEGIGRHGKPGTSSVVIIDAAGYSRDIGVNGSDVNHIIAKNWGLGARIGFDLGWHFTKEWSLYSAFTGNAIWNTYSTNTYDTVVQGSVHEDSPSAGLFAGELVDKTTTNYNDGSDQSRVNYVVEAELGLCWETFFYDDNYHFAAKVGWEMQDWINYMQTGNGIGFDTGDLMLQGLNVQLRFDF